MDVSDTSAARPAGRLVGTLLGSPVEVVESFGDRDATLFAEEAAYLKGAAQRRRAEFTTVRAHARQALERLGYSAAPLVTGDGGQPLWPDGVVGSITHCAGYRAVAVASIRDVQTIGIDAEVNDALPDGVVELVAVPTEFEWLARLPVSAHCHWDRLLFSAKEAAYKAWFPMTHEWLDFSAVSTQITPDGQFIADIETHNASSDRRPRTRFTGRWHATASHVAAAIAVPRGAG